MNAKHKKQDLSYFLVGELQPARENGLIYEPFAPNNNEDDRELYFDIKKNGIEEPLHISRDGVVLSGHRRYAVAEWLGLSEIPCIVENIIWSDLDKNGRLDVLARYNKQRDKSYTERLREALQEVDPDIAYQNLMQEREKRDSIKIENNVSLGKRKTRAKITTTHFLNAAMLAINSERSYWPLTVRRVHYLLLNYPPLTHDKKPNSVYRNDLESYKKLTNLLIRARLTGDIPMESITDETRPISCLTTYQNAADFVKEQSEGFLKYYYRDLLRGQENHIEILVEKNAIKKHIVKVAFEYCIPCTTGRGYSSLTPRWEMVKRFKNSGKSKLILLILSDFDPDGEEIAASFPRSLRDDFNLANVMAHKVALTANDIREHNIPCNMEAKQSSRNYEKFIQRHGVHVAELDAAPVELLQNKLRQAIESCLDMAIFNAELISEKDDYAYISATKRIAINAITCTF